MFKCVKSNKKFLMLLMAVGAFIVLYISYRYNTFGIVKDTNWFENWQADSEELIWTRISNIMNKGFGYKAGLLGDGYEAQIGLQGSFFGILKLIFGNYISLYSVTVFLSCLCFFYILKWIYGELGTGATLAAYIFLLFNQWLTVSAKNLYWVTFTFLLPFIVSLHFLEKEEKTGKLSLPLYAILIFIVVFIRNACGFEMISTILINMEVPLIYYAYKNKWDAKKFVNRFFIIGASGVLAFVACFAVHLIQLMIFTNDGIATAIEIMKDNIGKRTGALKNMKDYDGGIYRESLEATKLSVIKKYLFEGSPIIFGLRMNILLPAYVFFAALSFALDKYLDGNELIRSKLRSIILMGFTSLLAPFSWFVLASAHSYIHTHINFILWSLPTIVLMAAYVGAIIEMTAKLIYTRERKLFRMGAWIAIILMIYLYINSTATGFKYIKYVSENGIQIYQNSKVNVYLYEDKLYFVSESLDLHKRFFLHYYPDSSDTSSDKNQFLNYDFNYEDGELKTPFWKHEKITCRELPDQKVELTAFGQYDGGRRYWEYSVDLSQYYAAPNNITVSDLTNGNWMDGYNDAENCVLVPFDFNNYYLEGKYIVLPDDETTLITKVERHDEYQWVYTDRNISQYKLAELTIKDNS